MPEIWSLLGEALKSGYGKSVLLVLFVWITKPMWLELVRLFREWVRAFPARRRVALAGKAVDQALNAKTKEEGDRACEVLRLLLGNPDPPVPQDTDPPAVEDTSTGDPPP